MGTHRRPDHGWHVELYETEWVTWWYGSLADGAAGHVAPACTRVDLGELGVMEFPFELPELTANLPAPTEVRRERAVGWRARTNDFTHDCGWHLAADAAEARAAATAFIERHRLPWTEGDFRVRLDPVATEAT
jgi:hypothetical protein